MTEATRLSKVGYHSRHSRYRGMRSESPFPDTTGPLSGESVTADESLPCIVVFVAGERSCVDAAVRSVCQLYRNRRVVFICEPRHPTWLPQSFG